MSVCGDLDAACEPRRDVVDELICRAAVASANVPARNQLRIGIRRKPKPCVASINSLALHRRDILLLGSNKAPNFIDLKALAFQTLKNAILIPSGGLPHIHDEFADRRLANAGQARNGPNAHALTKEVNDLGTVRSVQAVHGCLLQYASMLVLDFPQCKH